MATNDELYEEIQQRMTAVATGAGGHVRVASCPEWCLRDLLAHVAGAAVDLVEGRLDGVGTDAWTDAQVRVRVDRSIEEILDEWAGALPRLVDALEPFGGAPGQLIFDTVSHEHDLRLALGVTGDRDAASIDVALDWVGAAWARSAPAGPGTLRLDVGDRTFEVGEGDPLVVLHLTPFEALRVLSGRRSEAQVRALHPSDELESMLGAFTWGPFRPAASDVPET